MKGWLPRRTLPVLMYHRIGPCPGGDRQLWVSEETFARHLRWIRDRGLRALSLDEAYECFRSRTPDKKAVLITFDDAFAETLDTAAPWLQKLGMRSTVFVPAGLLGQTVALSSEAGTHATASEGRIVDDQGLRRWVEAGQEVGSHSLTHQDLTTASFETASSEAARSKQLLEEVLERPVPDFCYPFAHHNAAARRAVSEAGYRSAYAGEPPTEDLFALPRMMVFPGDTEQRYARKLSGYYYWISAWHGRVSQGGSR
ncbi:MAG: polysaccharide deacetylase family protein [Nitrospirae bacterium]|nr:polysaccharide deacetylase family protein [Nitrospirota bacterium]